MKMRQLGRTDLLVSEICLGTGTFGGKGIYKKSGEIMQTDADYMVDMALDAGINLFDTAEVYSDGLAEEILGNALAGKRDRAVIISKVAPGDDGMTYDHIVSACERSLKRLRTDYLDVYELHMYDPGADLDEVMRALRDLITAGKIRHTGCSNFTGWQFMKAINAAERQGCEIFTTLEAKYSLLTRELENELIPACVDQGVSIVAFSPLYGGFLSGKYGRNKPWPAGTRYPSDKETGRNPVDLEKLYNIVDVLTPIAEAHNVPVSHAAMKYLLYKPAICSLITAARTPEQLAQNLTASELTLSDEEILALDRVSEPPYLYPYGDQKVKLNTEIGSIVQMLKK